MPLPSTVVPLRALEIYPDGVGPVDVSLPLEILLRVEINGRPRAGLMALPGLERELALGFCLSQGLIASFDDVLLVEYCRDEGEAEHSPEEAAAIVRLRARPEAVSELDRGVRLVLSGCGSVGPERASLDLPRLSLEGPQVGPEALWRIDAALRRSQSTYHQAGAVHAAGLFTAIGETLILAEDIGRHNAVDKVLGAALIRGLSLEDKILLGTGRASHDIVAKGVRLGVPVVASFSAPTSLAVELAEETGCTLIGRLRRRRFLVYTHPGRVLGRPSTRNSRV
ncbi:MAG: formate dehydrogenase accessory sulfurtransferase FdhD [Chloroflexia bacterium]|nr:formate dehydrogenase accessory sulfurtransferase FdhD [Chloroflexia bacterium]